MTLHSPTSCALSRHICTSLSGTGRSRVVLCLKWMENITFAVFVKEGWCREGLGSSRFLQHTRGQTLTFRLFYQGTNVLMLDRRRVFSLAAMRVFLVGRQSRSAMQCYNTCSVFTCLPS